MYYFSFISFFFFLFLPRFKKRACFRLRPRTIRHPTVFLCFLLQLARRGPSRPARAQGSARCVPPTAAPPLRPHRSARAATATTGRISTRRQLPAPVSNGVGVGGGGGNAGVSLPSAAGEAAGMKSQPMSFFIPFSPPVLRRRGARERLGGQLAVTQGPGCP